jgi:enolase-phosphatase E1
MKAILLDIEGTTTPIDFVHEVLFPYSRERIAGYVAMHFDRLHPEIEQLVDESSHDGKYTVPVDPLEPGSVSAYLEYLIDHDRKSTPLKSIQGKIWKEGYEAGELTSIVYDDVPPAFERWARDGRTVAIYSSGSELAQRLLFRHTDHGDLAAHISAHFDTTVGAKRDPESYAAIAGELGLEPADVLFISDIAEELDAASASGMRTLHRVLGGEVEKTRHRVIRSFDEVDA